MFGLVTERILSLAEQPFKGVEREHGRELLIKFGKSAYVVRYLVSDTAVVVTRVCIACRGVRARRYLISSTEFCGGATASSLWLNARMPVKSSRTVPVVSRYSSVRQASMSFST